MNGADSEEKHDYILNMDRLVSLMDRDRVKQGTNRRANKMYGWGGDRGMCVGLRSGCIFECPSRYSLDKEGEKIKVRSLSTNTPYSNEGRRSGGGAPAGTA
jgi:hypothetical protein